MTSGGGISPAATVLEAALAYERRGWSVIPIRPRDKKPAIAWTAYQTRRASPSCIREWFSDSDNGMGVGVVCGEASGLVVVDVDGSQGIESLKKLEAKHGPLPECPRVVTGGGMHLYFAAPAGRRIRNAVKFAAKLDCRGDGGYVVSPPSVHISGRQYMWDPVHPLGNELPPLPGWLEEILCTEKSTVPGPEASEDIAALIGGVTQGERNDAAARLAGWFFGVGMSKREVLGQLRAWNEKNAPPLPPAELETVVSSIAKAQRKSGVVAGHNDDGNVSWLRVTRPGTLRFVHGLDRWRHWDGSRWQDDEDGHAHRVAVEAVRRRLQRAIKIKEQKVRDAELKWASGSLSDRRINAMLSYASNEDPFRSTAAAYDVNPLEINLRNGILDLLSCELRAHSANDMNSKLAGTEFDLTAACPRFEAFVDEIFSGDRELIEFVQRYAGYSLSGMVSEQAIIFLLGRGANGKTTLVRALAHVWGDYFQACDANTFGFNREYRGGVRDDIASMAGARLVSASEPSIGMRLSEAKLKELSGGDLVRCRHLYGREFSYLPCFKIWITANHRPRILDTSSAFWRRLFVVRFERSFEDCADKSLLGKLTAEASGILNWCLTGFLAWREGGLLPPDKILAATRDYRSSEDILETFISECLELDPDAVTLFSILRRQYLDWCDQNKERPLSTKAFAEAMQERGFTRERTTGGMVQYRGIST